MDILAHLLWSYIIFKGIPNMNWALFFGIFPDLFSFAPNFLHLLFTNGWRKYKKKSLQEVQKIIPPYIFMIYDITHSLIISSVTIGLVTLIGGTFPIFMLAWPVHILFDIPTHTKDFFPTHFLYPFSTFCVNGIRWGQAWFMVTNYTFIIVLLFLKSF